MSQEDKTIANCIFCLVLVLIESLQLLIAVVLIFSFVPIPVSPLIHDLMPQQLQLVFPKRDMFFYHFWVASVIAGQAVLLGFLSKRLNSPMLIKNLRPFCVVEFLWLFLMVFAVFKFFVYGRPVWAMHVLYAALGGAVLSKIFWKELSALARFGCAYVQDHPETTAKVSDIIFPLVIVVLIFVPDLHAVLARMWIGDDLIHMDTTMMGLVWAIANGVVLNVDVWSHYGLGMPIFITLLAKALHLVSYTGVLSILVWGVIVYFMLCYFFLRSWLGDVAIGMAGIMLAIKWQMFHPGNYPFIFTYPYSTVWRNIFDIAVLFLLLQHLRRGNLYLLMAAGAVVGVALFNISDTGVYLFLAYVFYLFWLGVEARVLKAKGWKAALGPPALGLSVPLLSVLALLLVFQGANTWSTVFWKNMSQRAEFFFIGDGNLPIYKSLLEGDYTDSLMSFIMPLVYIGVLVAVFSLCLLRKIDRKHIMAAVLCVYGLGLYHYYIPRSANSAFYTGCIPFVLVLCWLYGHAVQGVPARRRFAWNGALLGLSAFALFSNHAFLNYPNLLNFSPNPIVAPTVPWPNKDLPYYFDNVPRGLNPALKLAVNSLGETDEGLKVETDFKTDRELKSYFDQEFDYSQDAALIDSLTPPGEAVPLLSSFEVRILMQADRRPFFYYYPIIDSLPRRMRVFPFSRMWTIDSLKKTIGQLEGEKPAYVFVEKIFTVHQVPRIYEYVSPDILYLLSYLDSHYRPYKEGRFLAALKRI